MGRTDEEIIKELELLKSEYARLDKKRIETETNLRNREEQLSQLRKKAEELYGTSDLNELRRLLEQWRAENERRVREYREHIEDIKNRLGKLADRAENGQ